jgi:hypothetical protein
MNAMINLCGLKFGLLVAIEYAGKCKWLCQCECGNKTVVRTQNLKNAKTKSCGCLRHQESKCKTHGMTSTPEYRTWSKMIGRCEDINNKSYNTYGGRGIKVCRRWRNSFECFYSDMGARPNGNSIERIDVNGDYEPKNCKWIPLIEQNLNKRNSRLYDYEGDRITLKQIVDRTGLPKTTVFRWLNAGQSLYKKRWARFT